MIKQYLSIKEQYPDTILFYRMGDFYEMFFEDAQLASRILEITLTSRNKNDESPIPMCGVPHRAAQSYIARLIDNGYKVAVCDQIENPAKAKGLVKRDVVRVITPGMVIENDTINMSKTREICLPFLAGIMHKYQPYQFQGGEGPTSKCPMIGPPRGYGNVFYRYRTEPLTSP